MDLLHIFICFVAIKQKICPVRQVKTWERPGGYKFIKYGSNYYLFYFNFVFLFLIIPTEPNRTKPTSQCRRRTPYIFIVGCDVMWFWSDSHSFVLDRRQFHVILFMSWGNSFYWSLRKNYNHFDLRFWWLVGFALFWVIGQVFDWRHMLWCFECIS